jgi:hypothetical protein
VHSNTAGAFLLVLGVLGVGVRISVSFCTCLCVGVSGIGLGVGVHRFGLDVGVHRFGLDVDIPSIDREPGVGLGVHIIASFGTGLGVGVSIPHMVLSRTLFLRCCPCRKEGPTRRFPLWWVNFLSRTLSREKMSTWCTLLLGNVPHWGCGARVCSPGVVQAQGFVFGEGLEKADIFSLGAIFR